MLLGCQLVDAVCAPLLLRTADSIYNQTSHNLPHSATPSTWSPSARRTLLCYSTQLLVALCFLCLIHNCILSNAIPQIRESTLALAGPYVIVAEYSSGMAAVQRPFDRRDWKRRRRPSDNK